MYVGPLQHSGSCSILVCRQNAFDNLLFAQDGTVISGSCSVLVCRQDAFGNVLFRLDDTVCSCRAELGYNDMSNFAAFRFFENVSDLKRRAYHVLFEPK